MHRTQMDGKSWFEQMTGFSETSRETVKSNLVVEDGFLVSKANGVSWQLGQLTTPSLAELRKLAQQQIGKAKDINPVSVYELVGDVRKLHEDPENEGAFFQVASQFNLLEMISPERTPEDGVTHYQCDKTQGPTCAIACGAGLIYRNYFVPVADKQGQTKDRQLDMLSELGSALGNNDSQLWRMKNGYALPDEAGLRNVDQIIRSLEQSERDTLMGLLRIGLHSNTQVTLPGCTHIVTQAYCSAMPVSYTDLPLTLWASFASFVLDASYEATLAAAVLNAQKTGNRKVYLTLLGGGAFGNDLCWILSALKRAILTYKNSGLEIAIVSYGSSQLEVASLVANMINDIFKQ